MEANSVSTQSPLQTVQLALFTAVQEVSELLRYEDTAQIDTKNKFGDQQLKIDVLSDAIIFNHLRQTNLVKYGLSEEKPELNDLGGNDFIVTFDPLDGSSIIDTNFSVGTIFAIWPNENALIGLSGRKIISAGIAVYGPRTTVLLYNSDNGNIEEHTLKRGAAEGKLKWVKTKDKLVIKKESKLFAPANLRASSDNKKYQELVEFWRSNKYTLRYTGGMVPDVYQIFLKGNGVFCNPDSPSAPAKLRLLYEVAPIGFLVEKASGKTSNGKTSVLDIVIDGYEQKTTMCAGSEDEVIRFEKVINS